MKLKSALLRISAYTLPGLILNGFQIAFGDGHISNHVVVGLYVATSGVVFGAYLVRRELGK